ncbi:calcium-binding protein CBP-like [Miscanthus floridulus]|uniref:calcium-binding protein CBP-like n=1 Tax=Miscanthus floridulus TaxID=154761 RepID=UPI003459367E
MAGYPPPPGSGYPHGPPPPPGYRAPPPYGSPPPPSAPPFGGAPPPPPPGGPFASLAADRDGSGVIDDKELQSALSGYNQSFSLRTVHLLMYIFTNTNVRKIDVE